MDMTPIKKAAAAIKEKRPSYQELIDFYEALFIAQERYQENVHVKPVELASDLVSLKQKEGFPLIDPESFPIDTQAALELFREICEFIPKTNHVLSVAGDKVLGALDQGAIHKETLFTSLFNRKGNALKEVANKTELDEAALSFLVFHAIRPSLCAGAEQLSGHLTDHTWSQGCCPVCGTHPILALLKEDGKRFLVCGLCGHEWKALRLFCPFCENQDQKKLQYFFSETERGLRVNLCDQCRHYIKTVDVKEVKHPVIPLLEHISTLHLDMLAREKGYESALPLWLPT